MPVTEQDLLEWTKEYATLRKSNPQLHQDFNEWIKTKIVWKENNVKENDLSAQYSQQPIPVNPPPILYQNNEVHNRNIVHLPPSNTLTPKTSSIHSPSPSPSPPSPFPSPPLITPKKQSHLNPHTPIPVLRNSSPLSNVSSPSLSSRPSSSSDTFSPHLSSHTKTRNGEKKYNQQLGFKDKTTTKRRYVSPPRTTLVRSLSQSLISPAIHITRPSPHQQQISHVTLDYPHHFPPSEDMAELRDYLNQFQTKQQDQLFQIFDIVENINSKISGLPVSRVISSTPSPSRGRSPSKGRMVPVTKSTHPILHPVSPQNKSLSKREPSPFAAIFRDQVYHP